MSDPRSYTMNQQKKLESICKEFGLLAIYLFGSRADDGLQLLRGEAVTREGSDLDVGVVFRDSAFDSRLLAALQIEIENLFALLRVDLVPLQRVDALFQFNAIDGHRIAVGDTEQADRYELVIMSRAAELLPIQRQIERERFGVSTT
ncbi:MAG TPA: nucleotidyltransferase domain-containing protein [Thermoanaerobaculia bacterium]|nr:nucleotidyltransferase domain-containing protein [Thermoanaerobaculia bacterium]